MLAKAKDSTVWAGLRLSVADAEVSKPVAPRCGVCRAPYVGFGWHCPNCLAPRPPVLLEAV